MDAPLQPVDITAYLATEGEAEVELRRLFTRTTPLVIFDIGACEGEDSVRYARRYPRARVFAFEPLPANQALVRANFAKFAVGNAELVPLALSDRSGEALFHVSNGRPPNEYAGKDWNYGNKSSSLLAPAQADPMHGWLVFKESITVRTTTLAQFCHERGISQIDFIHMDVQGAESLVLTGAGEMLRHVQSVWLEVTRKELYRGQKLRDEIQEFMQAHGFILTHESDRGDEGDQFYVNRHTQAGWRRVIMFRLGRAFRKLRSLAGALKRRLSPSQPVLKR